MEINLQSSRVVFMPNKPHQEMALHKLSSTVGADDAPLQPSGLHSSTSNHTQNPSYALPKNDYQLKRPCFACFGYFTLALVLTVFLKLIK